ncbi:MAG TPA: HAMP domain-containing sensor histidine kinase [Phycisphaeraceae bacterium]
MVLAIQIQRQRQRLLPGRFSWSTLELCGFLILSGLSGGMLILCLTGRPVWQLLGLIGLLVLAGVTWKMVGSGLVDRMGHKLQRADQVTRELDRAHAQLYRQRFFLNALSHDLRHPLHGLVLQAELIMLGLEQEDRAAIHQVIHRIRACVREISSLLNDVLDLEREEGAKEQIQEEVFDAAQMVREVVALYESAALRKGLRVQVDTPRRVMLCTDRNKMDRVLSNLVANAVKYTQRGFIRVRLRVTKRDAILDVIDTGPGIAPEHQARVFEAFYQVRSAGGEEPGHGLGLAIAQRLAIQMGGKLELQSQPGRGARFRLTLFHCRLDQPRPMDRAASA